MTALRRRMIEDMRVRNLSRNTQQLYVDRVAKFAQYFGRSPELLGPEDVRTYQVYLIYQKGASSSMLQQTVCALRFLYRNTQPAGAFARLLEGSASRRLALSRPVPWDAPHPQKGPPSLC